MASSKKAQIITVPSSFTYRDSPAGKHENWSLQFKWFPENDIFKDLGGATWTDWVMEPPFFAESSIIYKGNCEPWTGEWDRMDPPVADRDWSKQPTEAIKDFLDKTKDLGAPKDLSFTSIRQASPDEGLCSHEAVQLCSEEISGKLYVLQFDLLRENPGCKTSCKSWFAWTQCYIRIRLIELPSVLYMYDSRITQDPDPKWAPYLNRGYDQPEINMRDWKVTGISTHDWRNEKRNRIDGGLSLEQALTQVFCNGSIGSARIQKYNKFANCNWCVSACGATNCRTAARLIYQALKPERRKGSPKKKQVNQEPGSSPKSSKGAPANRSDSAEMVISVFSEPEA